MNKFNEFLENIKNIKDTKEASALLLSRISTPKIKKALDFAKKAHAGQKRKSGEDYVIHPILVAAITSYFTNEEDVITAALLHDVVEDTDYTIEYIKNEFKDEVAHLVEGLTKIVEIRDNSLIPSNSDEKLTKSALTFRKMLTSSIKDIRVLIIKLCDRVHNMLTLNALPPHKQKRIAEETLVVYAPIAHRLGIAKIKNVLEDLSFKYLLPEEYKKIDDYIQKNKKTFQLKLNSMIQKVQELMLENGFLKDEFEIKSRIKHYYSIYLKMQRKGISIEEVLDLLAIRVIVKEPIDCYNVLGLIHLNFRPLISRFKDYIAIPKENGYQTIHTTVYDKNSIIETQIRTFDMDKNAEYGIAAHWKYKLNSAIPNIKWLENLNFDEKNVNDFYELAKNDLFSEDIVVYTPSFDTITLPRGATALDFAYAIHSDIGNKAKEAYVNKEKVSLLHHLKTGDIVKIVTGEEVIPRCTWINAIKTSKAKYEQKRLCKQKEKEINRKLAISILATIFDMKELKIKALIKANKLCEKIPKIVDDEKFLKEVVKIITKTIKKKKLIYFKKSLKEYKFGNLLILSNKPVNEIKFNYCCHPKVGDKILGLLDKKEVEIHHRFCNNAEKNLKNAVFVKWINEEENRYFLVVSLPNKKGELAKFVSFISKLDIFIHSIELGKDSNNCKLEIEFDNKKFDKIKKAIKKLYNIIEFIPTKDAYNI